jgi:hypothetical protein
VRAPEIHCSAPNRDPKGPRKHYYQLMRIVYSSVQTILKIIKNTHRHPVNQALHSIGAPFYGIGLAMIVGHLARMQTDPYVGSAMFFSAMALFVLGHKIEGNIRSMAPVLLFRFLLAQVLLLSRSRRGRGRKVTRYPFAKRVHLLRT